MNTLLVTPISERYSMHGFHHLICTTEKYHEFNSLSCKLCRRGEVGGSGTWSFIAQLKALSKTMGGPEEGRVVVGADDDERLRRRLVMLPTGWSDLDRSSMMKLGGHVTGCSVGSVVVDARA
jgi:hypothetical protein